MRLAHVAAIGTGVWLLAAAPASADWLFTPYLGGTFGGDAKFEGGDFEDKIERQVTFGASLGWMGAGIVGAEVDVASTPNFFQDTRGDGDFDFGDSNVTTLMANVLLGAPIGGQRGLGLRPYASGGIGLIRSHIDGTSLFRDLTANSFGVNLGAGVFAFFTDHVGLRGDVRYFRSLQDKEPDGDVDLGLGDFDFWRATGGFTVRW